MNNDIAIIDGKIYQKIQLPNGKVKYTFLRRQDYFAVDAINFSTLKWMKRSPAHYLAAKRGELKLSTNPLRLGNFLHTYFLEREKLNIEIKEEYGGKGCKERIATQKKRAAETGITLVSKSEFDLAMNIAKSIEKRPDVIEMITSSIAEEEIYFNYRGYKCKGKLDLSNRKLIADLKFLENSEPENFVKKSRFEYDYDGQIAFYHKAATINNVIDPDAACKFITFEKNPPYCINVISVDKSVLKVGMRKVNKWFDMLDEAQETGYYKPYADLNWIDEEESQGLDLSEVEVLQIGESGQIDLTNLDFSHIF